MSSHHVHIVSVLVNKTSVVVIRVLDHHSDKLLCALLLSS